MTETYKLDASGIPTIHKVIEEELDYTFDWTDYLAMTPGDSITSEAVTITGRIVKGDVVREGAMVTVWLSGGAPGYKASAHCQIVTAAGRTAKRTINIEVVDRR